MTGTFTLTGRILDKAKAPVALAKLVLSSSTKVLADPAADEVYAPTPRITTDADGYLCVADANGVPDDTPGVPLVVGVQYRLRAVNRSLIDALVFTAPDAGTTLDIADIVPEPVDTPPTFADVLLDLASTYARRLPDPALLPTHAAIAGRQTKRVNIVPLGDSLDEGFPVTSYDRTIGQQLAMLLRTSHPTAGLGTSGGRGFIPIPTQGVVLATPVTIAGGAVDPLNVGAAEAFHAGGNRNCWYTNGSGTITLQTVAGATHVDIHHLKSAAGGATAGQYRVNGGAPVAFSTLNGTTIVATTRVTVTGAATVEVSCSGTGYVIVTGFQEYAGDETAGFQVHNAGHCGYTAAKWAADPVAGGWRDSLAALDPDLLIIQLGGNDAQLVDAATFGVNLAALVAVLRAGPAPLPTVPIMLSAMYDPAGATLIDPWADYVQATAEVAAADATIAGVIDHTETMPATDAAATYGLYDPDGVHGNANGSAYAFMAATLHQAIAP